MKITKNTVVTVCYTLSDAQGNLIEEGLEPIVYLHGGYDSVFPKIEEVLDGKEVGFSTIVQLEANDAFGEYDPELVKIESREHLPSPIEVGMQLEGTPEADDEDELPMILTVTDIADDKVVLDGNHPLAGIALRFTLNVSEVRTASEDEIDQAHSQSLNIDDDSYESSNDQFRSIPLH